jgi:VIT1/CCC1 family predicted Fe2+/Mn2+ transporter
LPFLRLKTAQLSDEEQAAIRGAFKDPASVQATGLKLAGVKFFITRVDDQSIYGKKGVRQFSLLWLVGALTCHLHRRMGL